MPVDSLVIMKSCPPKVIWVRRSSASGGSVVCSGAPFQGSDGAKRPGGAAREGAGGEHDLSGRERFVARRDDLDVCANRTQGLDFSPSDEPARLTEMVRQHQV
jgi:hypothetical protein